MRAIFSVLSLVIVLAIVGLLARKQLSAPSVSTRATSTEAAAGLPLPTGQSAGGNPVQQSRQVQQQVQQAVQIQLQARPMPEDQ